MDNTKNYVRQNNNIVLLVCDFYETKQIPTEMTCKKENLALFPVANIPLIEYILKSLHDQRLNNVIVTGKNIKAVEKHVKSLEMSTKMNFAFMEVDGASLGDVLRGMSDSDCDISDLLILYANHYTNFNLNLLFEKHRQSDFLMTLFLHQANSNSKINHFYGTRRDEIIFYEKCINGKYNTGHIKDTLETYSTVDFQFNLSSPTIGVISSDVLSIFAENFDYTSLGDLLEGLLAFNPFNHKIGFVRSCNGDLLHEDSSSINDALMRISFEAKFGYSREIITLYDYYKFNEDVRGGKFEDISKFKLRIAGETKGMTHCEGNYFYDVPDGYTNELLNYTETKVQNTVLGSNNRFKDNFRLNNCFVGSGCTISGNISKCIVWDDIDLSQDLNGYIVFSENKKISFDHLEIEIEIEEQVRATSTFFDDLVGYLKECLEEVYLERVEIEEVIKQVNMLRIIWNASDLDLIEAFAVFLTDIVSPEDVEDSAISASFFFPILEGSVNTPEKQEELLVHIYNQIRDKDPEFRKKVFCIYGYQLFEDGVISRPVFKEYNMLVKKGLL
ncbi:Translation initiation factor eIF-2B subunit epsilon [Nosema granulosis]|uniref:Translation initiation factor eIF-2B subunit epsilon n=1 Tax=Nosema granulosis TaxID=83296 RepID=A0A9P6H092_9MICR|nr:Translation initiation factor eIF-2B subunit epsilon [Nosema granulosis]